MAGGNITIAGSRRLLIFERAKLEGNCIFKILELVANVVPLGS